MKINEEAFEGVSLSGVREQKVSLEVVVMGELRS